MVNSNQNQSTSALSGLRNEEVNSVVYGGQQPARNWQVGDLISIGNRPECRLIINLTPGHIEVIAQSGWWNRYPLIVGMPLVFHQSTGLLYTYKGRELLYRDFKAGIFTSYFTFN